MSYIENIEELRRNIKETPVDGITFLPGEEEDWTEIDTFTFNEPGEPIGGSSMGKEYGIVLLTDDGIVTDKFYAILIDPLDYVVRMMRDGFYGVVGRRTTTSDKIFDGIISSLAEMNAEED